MKKLNDLINNLETYKELTTVPRDTLIKELKECKAELTEQLTLTDVSKQSELLQKIESVKNFEWGINPVDNENRMCELIKLL